MKYILLILLTAACYLVLRADNVVTMSGSITMSGSVSFNGTPSTDTNPPVFTSATLDWSGTNITLVATENLRCGDGGYFGWTNSAEGVMTYISGSNSTTLIYSVPVIHSNDTTTVQYTQPGTGWHDNLTNYVLTTTNIPVVNNSTQGVVAGTYIVKEDFGADAPWSTSGSFNLNYTPALDGAKSAYGDNSGGLGYGYTNFTAASVIHGYFRYKLIENYQNPYPYVYVSLNTTGSDLARFGMFQNGGIDRQYLMHGGASTLGDTLSTNQEYHVWFDITNATVGANGTANLYVSTDGTKPAATTSISNGDNTTQFSRVYIQIYCSEAVIDKFRLSATAIGSSPD